VTVLLVDEPTLKKLYHQNPSFGFHLITLVAARLSQDVRRVEQRLAERSPPPLGGGALGGLPTAVCRSTLDGARTEPKPCA
jgi:argininosuccinate lyase